MQPSQELLAYIKTQMAAGFSREQLTSTLTIAGWTSDAIEAAFQALAPQGSVPTPVAPSSATVETAANAFAQPTVQTSTVAAQAEKPLVNSYSSSFATPQESVSLGGALDVETSQPQVTASDPMAEIHKAASREHEAMQTAATVSPHTETQTSGAPVTDFIREERVAQNPGSRMRPMVNTAGSGPTLVPAGSAASVNTPKKKKSGARIFVFVLLLLIILSGVYFLMQNMSDGANSFGVIDSVRSMLQRNDDSSSDLTSQMSQTGSLGADQQAVIDAFTVLASADRLETRTSIVMNVPRYVEAPMLNSEGEVMTESEDPEIIDSLVFLDITSEAAMGGGAEPAQARYTAFARTDESTDLDAEVRVIGPETFIKLNRMSLLEVFGFVGFDQDWLSLDLAESGPTLTENGLAVGYLAPLLRPGHGSTPLFADLLNQGALNIESSTITVSPSLNVPIRDYTFAMDVNQLAEVLTRRLAHLGVMDEMAIAGLRESITGLRSITGGMTLDHESGQLLSMNFNVESSTFDGLPVTISGETEFELNAVVQPFQRPAEAVPAATFVQSIVDELFGPVDGAIQEDMMGGVDTVSTEI